MGVFHYESAVKQALLLLTLCSLTACGSSGENKRAGGVSAGEAQALDQAAEMIESRRLPDGALRQPAVRSGDQTVVNDAKK